AAPSPPNTTALTEPMLRAMVSISSVTFLTPADCEASTTTRTSAMTKSPPGSDELLGREELDELHAAVALVGDLGAPGPRRPLRERHHLRGRPGRAHLAGVDR